MFTHSLTHTSLTHTQTHTHTHTHSLTLKLTHTHTQWRAGDFIISDNLAIGHEASPDTQLPPEEVGLRVMHRTTVRGTHKPTKTL